MNEIANVSHQAFLQQLQNWELTLSREAKKLKQLRKVVTNKLQINTIDITLINIESQLIHYKKIREKKAEAQYGVIELYTSLSKRFMNIMVKIGESVENQRYRETNTVESDTNKTGENYCPNKTKHFLEETFTHKVAKSTQPNKNKSMVENKKQLKDMIKLKTRGTSRPNKSIQNSRKNVASHYSNLNRLELEQEEDLSDIRYQLKEIKSLMNQMEKEIKLHTHDQVDIEITRLSHNNKKLSLEIKSIKQDSQFVLARLQHLKQQMNHQKVIQSEMIKKMENGRDSRVHVHSINKDNKETEDISQWVKIRI